MATGQAESIQVFLRVRPVTNEEKQCGQESLVAPVGDGRSLTLLPPDRITDAEDPTLGRRATVATTPRARGTPRASMASSRRRSVVT